MIPIKSYFVLKVKFGENENDIDVIASNINNKKIQDKKNNFCIIIYVSHKELQNILRYSIRVVIYNGISNCCRYRIK